MSQPLNDMQLKALEVYSDGEHAHLATLDERQAIDQGKNDIGDSLLGFILAELSDAGEDPEEGARMMRSAARQLEELADAIETLA